ncbi:unnamed protein product [Hermetia illucens]|uniref:Uncharacterized protein n=1 Tax=Hermetia illucens TaxID=343691 RepID=A0A7R8UUE6_HERIL|nr:uncharacterized protein LOC119655343 [Hermetia illucens]XP_037917121.1 uncharacterized protein LOC119655343 [Hermetia illucens]CAD7086855.1 unnamed protein product [Hermetia illucens]
MDAYTRVYKDPKSPLTPLAPLDARNFTFVPESSATVRMPVTAKTPSPRPKVLEVPRKQQCCCSMKTQFSPKYASTKMSFSAQCSNVPMPRCSTKIVKDSKSPKPCNSVPFTALEKNLRDEIGKMQSLLADDLLRAHLKTRSDRTSYK